MTSKIKNIPRWIRRAVTRLLIAGAALAGGAIGARVYLEATAWKAFLVNDKNPKGGYNSIEFDAFRHAYASARLAQMIGPKMAVACMEVNEIVIRNDRLERLKDEFNNHYASKTWGSRAFAGFTKTDTTLSKLVWKDMQTGRVVTDKQKMLNINP